MVRANDPPSIEASRTVTGTFFVAIVDAIVLGLAFLWLLFICEPVGELPAGAPTTLTLAHTVHLLMIVSACVVYPLDVLYVPFWFIVVALGIAIVDVFVLVARASAIFAGGGAIDFGCDFFLLLFDVIFLLFAILYLAFAARSTTWYGSLGDTDIDEDPFRAKQPPVVAAASDASSSPDALDAVVDTSARRKKDDDATTPLLSSPAAFGLSPTTTTTSESSSAARRRALKYAAETQRQ